ncbi:hypothetical protein [Bradyrhizobium sp.]|uniref:hypothetical protein n=1 Tax=Bradyrhizobium sp. TaxID=376 RepID=UPI002732CDB0|nr:hypothetical protein [Bradyrhizobium sp.]MDP3689759.1 hypothetical protein [Bradyrhizobium sp.]
MIGGDDLFGWWNSKVENNAAQKSPGHLAQPDTLLDDLRQRVPEYLADIDQGKLIYPACKRTLADTAGDVGSVWDHTRLEAMQYVIAVPGGEFGLLSEAARQIEMIDGYLFQRPHANTVIDFTGTATADYPIAIVAGLNWLTRCAELAGVPLAQQTGTLRHFRKLVTLAQRWWLTEGAIERCGQMLANGEQPPLMLHLVWSEYTRLAKQIAGAAIFGGSIDRSAQLVALPADLVPRFEAANDPGELV